MGYPVPQGSVGSNPTPRTFLQNRVYPLVKLLSFKECIAGHIVQPSDISKPWYDDSFHQFIPTVRTSYCHVSSNVAANEEEEYISMQCNALYTIHALQ